MRERLQDLVNILFLGVSRPTLLLLAVYAAGFFALGLLQSLIYDWAMDFPDNPPQASIARTAILALLLLVSSVALFVIHLRQQRAAPDDLAELTQVTPHRGLVLILSPQNLDLPLWIMERHIQALGHVWVLMDTKNPILCDTLQDLKIAVVERDWRVDIEDVHVPDAGVRVIDAYEAVRRVYQEMAPPSLGSDAIITDITGGFKTMSVGVALACAEAGWSMSYVISERDDKGGNPKPVRLIGLDAGTVVV